MTKGQPLRIQLMLIALGTAAIPWAFSLWLLLVEDSRLIWWSEAWGVVGVFVSAVVSGMLAFLAGDRISRSIRALTREARAIGSGQALTGNLDLPSNEIGDLARALQEMSRQLESRRRNESLDLANRLEITVRNRTAELEAAYQELSCAYDELQKVDKLKASFLSTVSHELRTPLTYIVGFLEFMEEELAGPLSSNQREYLAYIRSGSEQLRSLVDDLLDFSRLESGELTLDIREVDYLRLLQELGPTFGPCLEKGIRLDLELVDRLPPLQADPSRLAQVIDNLVSNAIKHTEAGGRICIRAWEEDGWIVTSVSDTGCGIEPEHLEKIFSKFYRIDASLTRLHRGAGLGLAISKGLIEAHGGRIHAQSTPGQGATFSFELPAAVPARVQESSR